MEMEKGNFCTKVEETVKSPPRVGDSDLLGDSAASDVSQTPDDNTDDSWEHQLNTFKQEIEKLQERYEQSYLEIGRLLIQARDVYKGHGDWIKWLKENVPFSVRHAQRLIRVAEMFDDTTLVSQLGLTSSKAYILTRIGKNDIAHFLHTFFPVGDRPKMVQNMTKRELEFVVTRYLKGKLAATDHEEAASSNQGEETPRDSVESNLERLREALSRAIISIKDSASDTRESWISELEEMCKEGLDQLTSVSKYLRRGDYCGRAFG